MTWAQIITPDPGVPCTPGYCLQYVREAAGLPARYPTATAAWDASTSQHPDREFPAGLWTPVWYGLEREPAGHVVWLAPDGSVYSTSDYSTTAHHHPDLTDLEDFYAGWGWPLTYRGWTEDVAGTAVIAWDGITAQGTVTPLQNEEPDVLTEDQDATIHSGNIRAGVAADEATNSKVIGLEILRAVQALSAQVSAIGTPAAADRSAEVDRIVTEIGTRLTHPAP